MLRVRVVFGVNKFLGCFCWYVCVYIDVFLFGDYCFCIIGSCILGYMLCVGLWMIFKYFKIWNSVRVEIINLLDKKKV